MTSDTVNRDVPQLVENEGLAAKIDTVMAEAREAAIAAVAAYLETATKTPEGRNAGPPGAAYVYAVRPSYAFRTQMMDAGQMESSLSGRWNIGRFQDVVDDRSITAAEVACQAALEVLRKDFPGETFKSTSFLT